MSLSAQDSDYGRKTQNNATNFHNTHIGIHITAQELQTTDQQKA
jgi:hypothetical protein